MTALSLWYLPYLTYVKYKLDVIESIFKRNDGDITVNILSTDRYWGKHYPENIAATGKKNHCKRKINNSCNCFPLKS